MNEIHLAVPDLGYVPHVVLGGYLVMLLVFGIVGYLRSKHGEEDYYLAGRTQGWLVSSLTIMATFFSSFALLGAPGKVYREGVIFALFSLNVPLSGACVYVLGSRIWRIGRAKRYVTPADLIADYYGSTVALRVLAALIGFLYALPYVVMQIKAGGIISQRLFPGVHSFEIGCVLLALITMVYIMVGGMRSVAWTDVVQGLLLLGGMLLGGFATVALLGGPSGFFDALQRLPARSLAAPGTSGAWTPEKLFTIVLFASTGSMIQPAQWMRYYAARSAATLRRSALIFAVVLTACFLFGVMLVGLGGQAVYPLTENGKYRFEEKADDGQNGAVSVVLKNPDEEHVEWGKLLPHPAVGPKTSDFDSILVVIIRNHLPQLMGSAGTLLAALVIVAIMAAAMSTADSNLHAMSGVLTRDVYDRFIRPEAGEHERMWVGRGIIALATILAVILVLVGDRNPHFKPFQMIASLGFLAISFSTQLLPVTIDILFIRCGTRAGAIGGIVVGLLIVFAFSPAFSILTGTFLNDHDSRQVTGTIEILKSMADIGAWGLVGNVSVFFLLSLVTQRPAASRVAEFVAAMRGK